MDARSFNFRLKAFNAVAFLGSGIQLPFMPLWLAAKGLTPGQIAAIMALMMGVRSLAIPIGAYVADKLGNRRPVIVAGAVAAALAFAALTLVDGFWSLLAVSVIAAAFFAPVNTLAEVLAIDGSATHGLDFGRIRLWSSISFLAGNLLAGALLSLIPVWWVIWLIVAAQMIAAGMAFVLPDDPVRHALSGAPVTVSRIVRHVLAGPFFIFLAATTIAQSTHGMFYAIGSVHWDHMGLSKLTIGELWAVGVLAETLFFMFSRRAVSRFAPEVLIACGVAGGLVRWLIFSLDPPELVFYPASALHAASFALTHLGTMHFIQRNSPGGIRNSVQGVYSSIYGALLMSTMWASGPLYEAMGGRGYLAMAGLSAVALGLALLLVAINPKGLQRSGT